MFTKQSGVILKTSASEVEYLAKIRQSMSTRDFALLGKREFSKYIKNAKSVNHMVEIGSHSYELSTILSLSNSQWFTSALDFFCSAFRSAMKHHPLDVISIVEECYPDVHEALANYHDSFFLQNHDAITQPRLKVRAYFRMLGDTLESVHFPHIQFIYQIMTKVPDSLLYGRTQKVSNGKAVLELIEIKELGLALKGNLKNVPLSQWRNISHHSSYQYDSSICMIRCTYGTNHSVVLSLDEFESIMFTMDRLQALLKICVDFPLMDFAGSFKFDSSLEITFETLLSQLGNVLGLNGYSLIGIDKALNNWTVKVEDTCSNGVRGLKNNAPMLTPYIAFISDKGINITLELFTTDGISIQKAFLQFK